MSAFGLELMTVSICAEFDLTLRNGVKKILATDLSFSDLMLAKGRKSYSKK